MVFGIFGFCQDKRKSPSEVSSGTGYGGKKGDKKRLLKGRKKAEKASTRDDKMNLCFLKELEKQIMCQNSASSGDEFDVDDEDVRKKMSSLLKNTFQNQVPSEWSKRKELYAASLALTRVLASDDTLAPLLGEEHDQEGILFWLLDFREQGDQIIKHHHQPAPHRGSHRAGSALSKEDEDDVLLATEVAEVADMALKTSRRCQLPKLDDTDDIFVISLRERYQSQLGPLRFDSADSMQDQFFLKKVPHASSSLKTRLIFKELAAYRTALPVEYGSSCFCRVLSSRVDLLRVMITGPDDTPYANGCFFFDINLPTNYPRAPPLCQFLTTGGGKIRFNPNLYDCGKVCLSLLGTWAGPGWISGQSTLLQVLISIQSLILVPDPYFNEPCYEREMGTERGKAQSRAYNQDIRKHTLSAAIEAHLNSILGGSNQYIEFETVMIKHFLEKNSLIQKELLLWVKDDSSLLPLCDNICNQLNLLAVRERDPRSKRSRGTSALTKEAAQCSEPIVLDDSDVEEVYIPEKSSVVLKPKPIEIDLSDEDEKKEASESPRETSSAKFDGGLIDLTG